MWIRSQLAPGPWLKKVPRRLWWWERMTTSDNHFDKCYSSWQSSPTTINLPIKDYKMSPKNDISWQVVCDAQRKPYEYWKDYARVLRLCHHSICCRDKECTRPPTDQPALVIFDVFAAHRCSSVLEKLQSNKIHQVLVPAGYTSKLQPLNVDINDRYKNLMKNSFTRLYVNEAKTVIYGVSISEVCIDLKTPLMKPLHANWSCLVPWHFWDVPNQFKKTFKTVAIITVSMIFFFCSVVHNTSVLM